MASSPCSSAGWAFRRRSGSTAWLLLGGIVVAVGLSRIWLGVHYPSDVVGGWLLGGTFVASYAALTLRVSPASAAAAVGADPAAPRSDPPAAG